MKAPQAILGVFAAGWAIAGLAFLQAHHWTWALPVLISLALAVPAWRAAARLAPLSPERKLAVRRTVRKWSTIEGLAIVATIIVLTRFHRQDLLAAAIAAVVGVHFLPLARHLPEKVYWATGAALTGLGVVGLLVPQVLNPGAIGLAGAVILWLTMLSRPSLGAASPA